MPLLGSQQNSGPASEQALPEEPEKCLLALTCPPLSDWLPWDGLRPGKRPQLEASFSSEKGITWNLRVRPTFSPWPRDIFVHVVAVAGGGAFRTPSRPESRRGCCASSQQPLEQPLSPIPALSPSGTLQAPDTSRRASTPAWHLPPGMHKARPGPALRVANSRQATSQPGAGPAELQGGVEARGLLLGSLSNKTSAPLARRSEGRMQGIRGAGVRQPFPRSCAKHQLLRRGHSLALSCLNLLPSPSQLAPPERETHHSKLPPRKNKAACWQLSQLAPCPPTLGAFP